jgi:tetratricopeptide (TPR) repeat protein
MKLLYLSVIVIGILTGFNTTAAAEDSADGSPKERDNSAGAQDSARQFFFKGQTAFANNNYAEAARLFRTAYSLQPSWKLFYNIGQAEESAKHYGLALDAFELYVSKGGDDISQERQQEILKEISYLRNMVGIIEIEAPDGSELFVDSSSRGTKPFKGIIRTAVGKHTVQLKYKNKIIYNKNITISKGGVTKIRVVSESDKNMPVAVQSQKGDGQKKEQPDADKNKTTNSEQNSSGNGLPAAQKGKTRALLAGAIATGAGAVAGLTLGIIFNAKASGYNDDRANAKKENDYDSAVKADDKLHTSVAVMWTGYIAGAVLAATSATLFVLYMRKNKKDKKVAFIPCFDGIKITF